MVQFEVPRAVPNGLSLESAFSRSRTSCRVRVLTALKLLCLERFVDRDCLALQYVCIDIPLLERGYSWFVLSVD